MQRFEVKTEAAFTENGKAGAYLFVLGPFAASFFVWMAMISDTPMSRGPEIIIYGALGLLSAAASLAGLALMIGGRSFHHEIIVNTRDANATD